MIILYPQGTDHSSPGVDTGLWSTILLHVWILYPGLSHGSCELAVSKDDLQGAVETPLQGSFPVPTWDWRLPQDRLFIDWDFLPDGHSGCQILSAVHCWGSHNLRGGTPRGEGESQAGGPWNREGLTDGQGREMEPFLFCPAWSRYMAP